MYELNFQSIHFILSKMCFKVRVVSRFNPNDIEVYHSADGKEIKIDCPELRSKYTTRRSQQQMQQNSQPSPWRLHNERQPTGDKSPNDLQSPPIKFGGHTTNADQQATNQLGDHTTNFNFDALLWE